MSKILNYYNDKTNIDKVWYDSSNVLYSECDDIENDYKNLRLTFKNGLTYEYKNVDVNDYVMFREDVSQGKALNRLIKKYECEKLDKLDVDKLNEELNELKQECNEFFDENVNVIINDEKVRSCTNNRIVDININDEIGARLNIINVLKSIGIKVKIK